jgi:putative membrane protein
MKRHSTGLVIAVALSGTAACAGGGATRSAGNGSPSVSGRDRSWLAVVHQANLAEVEAGELAEKKGTAAAVRAAGAMLVTDHTASDAEVTRVAKSLGITLPGSVTPEDAAAAKRLGHEAGAQFDDDFVATMTTGHRKAITATRAEIAQGADPQVKALARTTLPVLRKHLTTLQKAAGR